MAIFGMFGLLTVGGTVSVYAGVDINGPIEALATGPTSLPVADLTAPFGLTPEAIGVPAGAIVVLPAVPVTVEVFGVTLSASGLTVAQVSGGGGLIVGFFVGLYYLIDVLRERRAAARTTSHSSTE